MTECKGCGAKIEWALIDGKKIPLDARNHPIYQKDIRGDWVRIGGAKITHFATCSAARQFSGKNNAKP